MGACPKDRSSETTSDECCDSAPSARHVQGRGSPLQPTSSLRARLTRMRRRWLGPEDAAPDVAHSPPPSHHLPAAFPLAPLAEPAMHLARLVDQREISGRAAVAASVGRSHRKGVAGLEIPRAGLGSPRPDPSETSGASRALQDAIRFAPGRLSGSQSADDRRLSEPVGGRSGVEPGASLAAGSTAVWKSLAETCSATPDYDAHSSRFTGKVELGAD